MEYKKEPSIYYSFGMNFLTLFIAGFIGIWAWKKELLFTFLSEVFSIHHLIRDAGIGILLALIFICFVHILIKCKITVFPHNQMTQVLIDGCKAKGGPLFMGLCSGIPEEWLFRGLLFSLLCDWMNPYIAIILSSLVFMSLHISQYKGYPFIHFYILFFSIVITFIFFALGTLWSVMICHVFYNTVLFYWLRSKKLLSPSDK